VVTEAAPTTYVQRDPGYRYYCRDPAGFYPDVPNCGSAWLKVVPEGPQAAPPVTGAPQ